MFGLLYRWGLARLGLRTPVTDMLRRWAYGEPLAWFIGCFILGAVASQLVPAHCRVWAGIFVCGGLLLAHLFWGNNHRA